MKLLFGYNQTVADPQGRNPTLTFTAYAVQQEGVTDAATAWDIAKDASAT